MLVVGQGCPYELGYSHGKMARLAIKENLLSFWSVAEVRGLSRQVLLNRLEDWRLEDEGLREEVKGLAQGSDLPYLDLLAYNLFKEAVLPEECTMMVALSDSTASGNPLYLKNSDKVGGKELVGPKYHKNKEINVVRIERFENGRKMIGVSAAGETGIKMGLNDKGIATGSNIARTLELKMKKVSLTQVRALDRAELMRRGLQYDTALQAGKWVLGEILENPMATPGNIHFVDAKGAYLLEGSYDRVATLHQREGVAARANAFVLLKELNDPEDISSQARYIRASRLLQDSKGSLTLERLIEFSQDHENGPGLNSICRHDERFEQETSLSAAVMEIRGDDPSASIIRIALGKPCHAWRSPEGSIELSMKMEPQDLPEGFQDGSVWKRFYTEEPYR